MLGLSYINISFAQMGANKSKQVADIGDDIDQIEQIGPVPQQINLKIATAKVGESYSPFEFYHKFQQIDDQTSNFDVSLNRKFQEICEGYGFVLSDYDECLLRRMSKMTTSRYTPLFNEKAGLKNGKYLLNYEEFNQEWDRVFDQVEHKIGVELYSSFESRKKQLRKKLKQFDIICYHALLAQAYNSKDTIDTITKNNSNFQYQLLLGQCFDSPLNKTSARISLIIKYANNNNIDIVFLQEISRRSLKILDSFSEQYRVSHMDQSKRGMYSAIMIRKTLTIMLDPLKMRWPLQKHNHQYIDPKVEETIREEDLQQSAGLTRYQSNREPKQRDNMLLPLPKKHPKVLPSLNRKSQELSIKVQERKQSTAHLQRKDINSETEDPEEKIKQMRQAEIIKEARLILSHLNQKTDDPENEDHNKTAAVLKPKRKQSAEVSPRRKNQNRRKGSQAFDKKQFANSFYEKTFKSQTIQRIILIQNTDMLSIFDVRKLNFGSSTTLQFIGNLILISTHLEDTVSETVNQQMFHVLQGLKILKKKFPHHSVLMGLDIENNLQGIEHPPLDQVQLLRNKYFCIPFIGNKVAHYERERAKLGKNGIRKLYKENGLFTVNSIKSNFQLDREQVDQKWLRCQNYLISSIPLHSQVIETCKNQCNSFENTLPHEDHPFVNYFVRGELTHQIKPVRHQRDRKRSWQLKPTRNQKKGQQK